jgi:uncharacterized protein (DUF433 family)
MISRKPRGFQRLHQGILDRLERARLHALKDKRFEFRRMNLNRHLVAPLAIILPILLRESCTIKVERNSMANLDWSQCPAVESIPGKRSGAWVFKGTRMPVATVFENLEAGLTVEEVMEEFGVTREQINAVLHFAAQGLATPPLHAPAPTLQRAKLTNPNRRGRSTKGLYPQVSRHKLAAEVGSSVQYVSRILLGHHEIKGFGLMLKIATALGITPKQFKEDLDNARDNHLRENGNVAAPKT